MVRVIFQGHPQRLNGKAIAPGDELDLTEAVAQSLANSGVPLFRVDGTAVRTLPHPHDVPEIQPVGFAKPAKPATP